MLIRGKKFFVELQVRANSNSKLDYFEASAHAISPALHLWWRRLFSQFEGCK